MAELQWTDCEIGGQKLTDLDGLHLERVGYTPHSHTNGANGLLCAKLGHITGPTNYTMKITITEPDPGHSIAGYQKTIGETEEKNVTKWSEDDNWEDIPEAVRTHGLEKAGWTQEKWDS